jgi:hypothetical protein
MVLLAAVVAAGLLVLAGSAKPEHLLTILGIVAGLSVVVFQLGEQQRASLELQRENARQALRLKVYEQLLDKIGTAYTATSDFRRCVNSISTKIESAIRGVQWTNETTSSELLEKSSESGDAVVSLIVELERWEVSFATADLFRWALSASSEDIQTSFQEFFKSAVLLLPHDKSDPRWGKAFLTLTSVEELKKIKELADSYFRSMSDLHCYLHDLVIEAQNELLSNLFDRRVAGRRPLDPGYKVISESNRGELEKYFKKETALGRSMEEARDRVLQRLAEK